MKRFAHSLKFRYAVIILLLTAPCVAYWYTCKYPGPVPHLWSDADVDRMTIRYVYGELAPYEDGRYFVQVIPDRTAEAALRLLESSWYRSSLGRTLDVDLPRYSYGSKSKLPVERAYRLLQTDVQRLQALPLLLPHASSPDTDVRSFVFRTVIPSGDDRVLPIVPLAMADSPPFVKKALSDLVKAIESQPVSDAFKAAAWTTSCSQIKARTNLPLAVSLGLRVDSDRFVKFLESQSLLNLKTGDSSRVLDALLEEHSLVARSHVRAWTERSLELPPGDDDVDAMRMKLFVSLGKYRDPDDEPFLMSLMNESGGPHVRNAALGLQEWHGFSIRTSGYRSFRSTPYGYCTVILFADGIIRRAGLDRYLRSSRSAFDEDWIPLKKALQEVQMTDSLDVFQRTLDLFPGSRPNSFRRFREKQLDQIDADALSQLSQEWNALHDQRLARLTEYAIVNKRDVLREAAPVRKAVDESGNFGF